MFSLESDECGHGVKNEWLDISVEECGNKK